MAPPKAEADKQIGFIEEVRDYKPTVYRDQADDPQDRMDDTMPVGEFYAFQTDAEEIVGRKPKAAKVAA